MWEDNREWTLVFYWRKRYYGLWTHNLARSDDLKLKWLNGFVSYIQIVTSEDVNWCTGVVWITCGLLWCFYQLFGLSFWRHPFTAGDSLVSEWCNAKFIRFWWRNKVIYILYGLRVTTYDINFTLTLNYIFESLWTVCFFRLILDQHCWVDLSTAESTICINLPGVVSGSSDSIRVVRLYFDRLAGLGALSSWHS